MMRYSALTDARLFVIAGPCVMEDAAMVAGLAAELAGIVEGVGRRAGRSIPFVFKASFDKANRTSAASYRGPGLRKGLAWLEAAKAKAGVALTTDIHEPAQAAEVAKVVDIIQIPAFLSRQTDLLMAAGRTGRIVNIKKAQFLTGHDMRHAVEKVFSTGNRKVLLTERGNYHGYADLIVDFRNIGWMRDVGVPVVMDCTHAVQRPAAGAQTTGGDRRFVGPIALAAWAFGARGFFFEVHPDPSRARSDRQTQITPGQFEKILQALVENSGGGKV